MQQEIDNTSNYVGNKYNFSYLTNEDKILLDDNIDTIFIATRNNLHAETICEAIKQDKNIFSEKPLAINENELEKINEDLKINKYKKSLVIGFNREVCKTN